MSAESKVAVCLWFDGKAEEAATFYTSLLPNSRIQTVARPGPDMPALIVTFSLAGTPFQALNGGPQFQHTEAASISVTTGDQDETDRLWDALIADGGSEGKCGWLKDRFGVSWQIIPEALHSYIGAADKNAAERALQAMLGMGKIVISKLEAAFNNK